MKNLNIYITFAAAVLFFLSGNGVQAQEIKEYLKIAAEHNPEVKAAYSRFEAALQKAPQVSALPDPTLTVSAFGQMMETRLGAQEARFSLMQMFPWFGKLKAEKNTAELMAEVQFQKYLLARQKLFLEVRTTYAEMYSIMEEIKLREKNLEILDSYRKLALNRFEAGSAPMVNVIKVDINRDEAATGIELMREELETIKKQFNLLLNRNTGEEVVIGNILEDEKFLEFPGLSDNLDFSGHPEVEMLEKERLAYESEQIVAERMGMPMVGLGVDYTIISKRTDASPMDNGMDAVMPMLSISLPIFRKKYKAGIEEARYKSRSVAEEKEATINELRSEFEMTVYTLKKARRLIDLYDKQIQTSGQANKLLISGFSNANSDFEEVLQMNQDILMFQTEKIAAQVEAYIAAMKLEFLLFKHGIDENR